MMDICVINPFFYPYLGGTEKVLLQVYSRLAKKHNITVISGHSERGKDTTTEHMHGIKIIRLKTRYVDLPVSPLPFMWMDGVQSRIIKEKADVYHINNRYLYYGRTILAIKAIRRKFVLTIHNSLPRNIDFPTNFSGYVYDKAWSRSMMAMADAITGVSKDAIDVTVPNRMHGKCSVIYNGVDSKLFKPHGKKDSKVRRLLKEFGNPDRLVLNNARLVPQKGQAYLMNAVSELAKERKERIHLAIIGRGPMENKLRAHAHALGLDFDIVSGIPEPVLPYYYNASDAFVLPSLYEPAGAALLEALSCETPSLATHIGGIPEYMKGYGFYVQDRSSDSIKKSLSEVFDNPARADSLSKRARMVMIKEHNWNNIARQYEDVFLGLSRR